MVKINIMVRFFPERFNRRDKRLTATEIRINSVECVMTFMSSSVIFVKVCERSPSILFLPFCSNYSKGYK